MMITDKNQEIMKWLLVLFLMGTLYAEVTPKRILAFFPLIAKSHHYIFRPIIEELAKRGHEVLYVTGYAFENGPPKGITEINIKQYLPFKEGMSPFHYYFITKCLRPTILNPLLNFVESL